MAYYNKLSNVNEIPKQIVKAFIEYENKLECDDTDNNDDLFKLLKYNTPDALSLPITIADKVSILKQNSNLSENGVIFQRFNSDTFEDKVSQIRIYIQSGRPSDNILSDIIVGIDIVVHNDLMILDKGDNRVLILLEELMKTLNGLNIGLGILSFNNRGSFQLLDFNKSFQGYRFMMGARSV